VKEFERTSASSLSARSARSGISDEAMREKDFNTGLRGVLFESRHYARMGAAVWLYGWLVLRQTHQSGGVGYVLGGAPVTYREIEEETGFNRRTLEAWMRVLRREGYIETQTLRGGIGIRILRAKKHRANASVRGAAGAEAALARSIRSDSSQDRMGRTQRSCPVRTIADGVRDVEGNTPRYSVGGEEEVHFLQTVAAPIRSSSVVGIEEIPQEEIHRRVENQNCANLPLRQGVFFPSAEAGETKDERNTSCVDQSQLQFLLFEERSTSKYAATSPHLSHNACVKAAKPATPNRTQTHPRANQPRENSFPWELRKRMQLLRAEREEEMRRELYVGTGPEGRHR
jgi:hypothetical protein